MFTIAIVEDEELEREALKSILSKGLETVRVVGEARNGREALALLDGPPIDLMLVDINIPKPTGLEIIQAIRDRHLATRVIITTAYDYFNIMRSAIHLKADDYLLKPIRPETLLAAVSACLETLDSDRTGKEVAEHVGALLDRNAYRDCLALTRSHVDRIYGRKGEPPRDAVLDFTTALLDLVIKRGLRIPQRLTGQLAELEDMRLDDRTHHRVLSMIEELVNLMFEVSEERFGQSPKRIQNVLNYIERNLHTAITLEEVATFTRVTPSYLSRLFKKSMDETFISYLTRRRMEWARKKLVESDQSVTEIALDLGYQDVNYFCKSFKKETGVSPTVYRRDNKTASTAVASIS